MKTRRGRALTIHVLFTSEEGTAAALEKASSLAMGLRAQVRLMLIHTVPYTLPLTRPAVATSFLQAKLAGLAKRYPEAASAEIYLCRESTPALRRVLPQNALVVMGGRKRWWPTRERRLISQLSRLGHSVVFVNTSQPAAEEETTRVPDSPDLDKEYNLLISELS